MRWCCCQSSVDENVIENLPTVELEQGQIVGSVITRNDTRIAVYSDIPFAKCSRFEKPKPYGPWLGTWDGTRRTRRFPASATLEGFMEGASPIFKPIFLAQKDPRRSAGETEESLHLSVTVPMARQPMKPVMVWIGYAKVRSEPERKCFKRVSGPNLKI